MLASQAPICSLLIYNPERRQEAWRFLTYQFVHVNMEHIVFNTLMQVRYKVNSRVVTIIENKVSIIVCNTG